MAAKRTTFNKRERERERFERRQRKDEKKRAARMAKSLGLKAPPPEQSNGAPAPDDLQ